MSQPITIAIPVFNRGELVKKTLSSILEQTFRPLNIILVDNNSTDNTWETLSHWADQNASDDFNIKVIKEDKRGAAAARNAALSITDTEWLMFFDSDDIMPADHIARIAETIDKHPDAELIGWSKRIYTQDGKTLIKKFTGKNPEYNNLTQSILSTLSYLARTSLFKRAGGWDETTSMGDDIELGSRLLKLHPKIYEIKNHYVEVHDTNDSISNSNRSINDIRHSLEKIRATLPQNKQHWVDLQLLIKAASWGKNDPLSPQIADDIIRSERFPRRLLWKIFYLYQLKGGRGVARLYSLLHFNQMCIKD